MSRPGRDPQQAENLPSETSFEEAVGQLEAIVEAMESDDLPLETLLSKFEEGAKWAKFCQERLAAAELRVKTLEKTVEGAFELRAVRPPEAPVED